MKGNVKNPTTRRRVSTPKAPPAEAAPAPTAPNRLQQALAASLPVSTQQLAPPTRGELTNSSGVLGRIFESPEARRHRQIQDVIRNVTAEVVLANDLVGVMANDVLATSLETEKGFQETLVQYRDYELPMAVAPTYVQLARNVFSEAVTDITQAGAQHIRNKIANR